MIAHENHVHHRVLVVALLSAWRMLGTGYCVLFEHTITSRAQLDVIRVMAFGIATSSNHTLA
jgi:hypothetical protein